MRAFATFSGILLALLLHSTVSLAQGVESPSIQEEEEKIREELPGQSGDDPFVEVEDPMLASIEAPAFVLKDWRQALEIVRNRNPDLKVAYAQIQVASGQGKMALASVLPQLMGSGNANYHILKGNGFNFFNGQISRLPDPNLQFQANGRLSIPVLDVRGWYDAKTAKLGVAQAQFLAEDAERGIVGGLAQSIVTVVTAERLAEVTRVNLASALSSLALNRKRARLGSANAIDVLRGEQEVAVSRGQVVEADEALRKSRESLGLALGSSDAWGVDPQIKLDTLRADARATCAQGETIEQRPDILAADEGKEIARRNAKAVTFDYLPTLSAETILTYTTNELQTANRKNITWTLGAMFSWHIFDGGLRGGEKRQNQGLYEQQSQQAQKARLNARLEVTQSYRGVNVAKSSLEIAKTKRDVAMSSAKLSRIKFVNGTGSSFDLVDTQSAARQSELDVTVKEFELLQAEIAAFLALASCEI